MGIDAIIFKKIIEFEMRRGAEPRSIELGHNEMGRLLGWSKKVYGLGMNPELECDYKFCGIECYEVNMEHYFKLN